MPQISADPPLRGRSVVAGDRVSLVCRTDPAGHPPAEISWSIAGEPVKADDFIVDGNEAISRLTFVPGDDVGTVEVACEAKNEAVERPLRHTIRIDVEAPATTTATTTTTERSNSIYTFLQGQVRI